MWVTNWPCCNTPRILLFHLKVVPILFGKTSEKAPQAAEAMGLTSTILEDLGIVDTTIEEPEGGAHRDPDLAAQRVKEYLVDELAQLQQLSLDDLLDQRYARLMSYGNP